MSNDENPQQAERDVINHLLKRWTDKSDIDAALQILSFTTQYFDEGQVEAVSKIVSLHQACVLLKESYDSSEEKTKLFNRRLELEMKFRKHLHLLLSKAYVVLKQKGFMKQELVFDDLEELPEVEELDSPKTSHQEER